MLDSDEPTGISCAACGSFVPSCAVHEEWGTRLCGTCAILEQQKAEERRDTRECPKCFKKTRSWGRKGWRDGREYCKDCAKELERVWFIGHSCMLCNRLIQAHERRAMPPERMQQKDPYVKSFLVTERSVCWECYVKATKRPSGVKVLRKTDEGSSTGINWNVLRIVRRKLGALKEG